MFPKLGFSHGEKSLARFVLDLDFISGFIGRLCPAAIVSTGLLQTRLRCGKYVHGNA